MGLETNIIIIGLLFLMSRTASASAYNVKDYGAVGDGQIDSTKAIQEAWSVACAVVGNPWIVIQEGAYLVGPLIFQGPCKGVVGVYLQGELLPSTNLNAYAKNWIAFHYINGFASKDIKFDNVKINAPRDSPNTDGIHINDSTNINIVNSVIGTDHDCISIGPSTANVTISKVLYSLGHGISVSSFGKNENEKDVIGLTVRNCTLNGTTNGLRIKTWQSSLFALVATNLPA